MIPLSSVGATIGAAQQTSTASLGPAPAFCLLEVVTESEGEPLPIYALATGPDNMMYGYAQATDTSAFAGQGVFFTYSAITGEIFDARSIGDPRLFFASTCGVADQSREAAYFKGRTNTPFDLSSGISIVRFTRFGTISWRADIVATGATGVRPFDGDVASYEGDAFFACQVPNADRVIFGRISSGGSLMFIKQIVMPAPGVRLAVSDYGILLNVGGAGVNRMIMVSHSGESIFWQKEYVGDVTSGAVGGTVAINDTLGIVILGSAEENIVRLGVNLSTGVLSLSDEVTLDLPGLQSYTHIVKHQIFPGFNRIETSFQMYDETNDEQLSYLMRLENSPSVVERAFQIREALGYSYTELLTSGFEALVDGAHLSITGTNGESYLLRLPITVEEVSPYNILDVTQQHSFSVVPLSLTTANTAYTLSNTTQPVVFNTPTSGGVFPQIFVLETS